MTGSALLLGAVLTFGASDGTKLDLTVSLSSSSTLSLDWGGVTRRSDEPSVRHHFSGLPTPRVVPTTYRLMHRGSVILEQVVRPIPEKGPLTIALYGDSRDGEGPHRIIAATIAANVPDILVHTGDVVHRAGDEQGWVQHLAASFPASSSTPLVYALGNHELWQPWQTPSDQRIDAYAEVMAQVPPPDDPIAKEAGVHAGVYHVVAGPTLFIALDSNRYIGTKSEQGAFLERVLEENAEATFKFIVLHHGPASSGRHGPSDAAEYLMRVADEHDVTAILAGHDHLYERIVQRGVTVIVSGGGGAPLYQRHGFAEGSQAFVSTYHWVKIDLDGDSGTIESYALEGTLLDRGTIPAGMLATTKDRTTLVASIAGACLLFIALVVVLVRIVRRGRA